MTHAGRPSDLDQAGDALWRVLVDSRERTPLDRLVIAELCATVDELEILRQASVGAEPLTVDGQPHPLFDALRQHRRLLIELARHITDSEHSQCPKGWGMSLLGHVSLDRPGTL